MGAVPQAKTYYYDGIEFKSNLGGKTAQALDNLGIRWESWFINELGIWQCPHCGAYDGDHYVRWIIYGVDHNLFDAAGVKRYGGPR